MFLAALLAAHAFTTDSCSTGIWIQDPLYVHAQVVPLIVPVAPPEAAAARIAAHYTFSNYAINIDNPFDQAIVAIDVALQIQVQIQAEPGVQYPALGGIGSWNHYVISTYVPPHSSVSIPWWEGISQFGPWPCCFGENATACGTPSFAPVDMDFIQHEDAGPGEHTLWFSPMTNLYLGAFALYDGQDVTRVDMGWVRTDGEFVYTSADVVASGTITYFDANGGEL